MKLTILLPFVSQAAALVARSPAYSHSHDAPSVRLRNGTYKGSYSPEYKQDFFLGVPYAQPPVGDLRFRNPQSLASEWKGEKAATKFSPACVGYGVSLRTSLCKQPLTLSSHPKWAIMFRKWVHHQKFIRIPSCLAN